MARYSDHYEEVMEEFLDSGLVDPQNILSDDEFWRELKRNDTCNTITFGLFEQLRNTRAYRQAVEDQIVLQRNKTFDKVTNGEEFIIEKPIFRRQLRDGRVITYRQGERRPWQQKELQWLVQNKTLPVKTLLYRYYQRFGAVRTTTSITSRRYALGRVKGGGKMGISRKKKPELTRKQQEEEAIRQNEE